MEIESSNLIRSEPLGRTHTAELHDTVKVVGGGEYPFMLKVCDNATKQPVLLVTSEVNRMAGMGSGLFGGSHFLAAFNNSNRWNYGTSDDWGDPDKFFPRALELARARFRPPEPQRSRLLGGVIGGVGGGVAGAGIVAGMYGADAGAALVIQAFMVVGLIGAILGSLSGIQRN